MKKEVFIFKKNKCLEDSLCDVFHSYQWLERAMQMYSLILQREYSEFTG